MISVGRKTITKLYRGDKRVKEMYKGGNLIYEDFEEKYGFKVTFKTSSANTSLYMQSNQLSAGATNNLIVDWGDGTTEKVTIPASTDYDGSASGDMATYANPVTHRYSATGTYQVTILPGALDSHGRPLPGWLSGIQLWRSVQLSSARASSSLVSITSIDTPYPEHSFVLGSPERGFSTPNVAYLFYNLGTQFRTFPEGLFDNLEAGGGSGFTHMAAHTFEYTKYRTSQGAVRNDNLNICKMAKPLFDRLPTHIFKGDHAFDSVFKEAYIDMPEDIFANYPKLPDASYMYYAVFQNTRFYSPYPTISSGFFRFPDGTTDASYAFSHLLTSEAPNQTYRGYLAFDRPFAGAFIDSQGNPIEPTNLSNLFSYIYSHTTQYLSTASGGYSWNSTTYTIPSNFFEGVNTGKAEDVSYMFDHAFYGGSSSSYTGSQTTYANATFEDGAFDFLDTSSAINFEGMFSYAFYRCNIKFSGSNTIADFFKNIYTDRATNLSKMFQEAFSWGIYDGNKNHSIALGNWFSHFNTSNALNFSSMFSYTFYQCAFKEIPADIFDSLNTSNGVDFGGMFRYTFGTYAHSGSYYPTTHISAIPTVFSRVDTTHGVSFDSMFSGTFAGRYIDDPVPDNLFTIDLSNAESANYLFQDAFRGLPDTVRFGRIFNLTPATEKLTSTKGMFNGTFYGYSKTAGNCYYPEDLFSTLYIPNTLDATEMYYNVYTNGGTSNEDATFPTSLGHVVLGEGAISTRMFRSAFQDCKYTGEFSNKMFAEMDWSKTTSMNEMFHEAFRDFKGYMDLDSDFFHGMANEAGTNKGAAFYYAFCNVKMKRYPFGLFSKIGTIPNSSYRLSNNTLDRYSMEYCFYKESGYEDFPGAVYEDIFGTPHTESVNSAIRYMVASADPDTNLGGFAAPTVAQFPSSSPYMFRNRLGLYDHYSIPTGWGGESAKMGDYGSVLYQTSASASVSSVAVTTRAELESLTGSSAGWSAMVNGVTLNSDKDTYPSIRGFLFGKYLGGAIPDNFLGHCTGMNMLIHIPKFGDVDGELSVGNYFLRNCTSFNSPVTFTDEYSYSIGCYFLSTCTSFDQPLEIPNLAKLRTQSSGSGTSITYNCYFLYGCSSFNQPIDSILAQLTEIPGYFMYNCTAFNQPLVIPPNVTVLKHFFAQGWHSYNHPLTLPATLEQVNYISFTDFRAMEYPFYFECPSSTLVEDRNYFMFSFTNSTTPTYPGYVNGLRFCGTYGDAWKAKLADRSSYPYRKIVACDE